MILQINQRNKMNSGNKIVNKVFEILKNNLSDEELFELSDLFDNGRQDEFLELMDSYLIKVMPDKFNKSEEEHPILDND